MTASQIRDATALRNRLADAAMLGLARKFYQPTTKEGEHK